MFQSLIGRLQTANKERRCMMTVVFQSLIGRLQTPHNPVYIIRTGEFQSLIGRLQTGARVGDPGRPGPQFQSLIGRLQTAESIRRMSPDMRVSIPHR